MTRSTRPRRQHPSTPTSQNIRLGRLGEAMAVRYLRGKGMLILDRNWRCRWGEIDIVGMLGSELVICEVKTRMGHGHGSPLEAITPTKRKRLHRLGELWLAQREGNNDRVRIDAIGISISPATGEYNVHHAQGI